MHFFNKHQFEPPDYFTLQKEIVTFFPFYGALDSRQTVNMEDQKTRFEAHYDFLEGFRLAGDAVRYGTKPDLLAQQIKERASHDALRGCLACLTNLARDNDERK